MFVVDRMSRGLQHLTGVAVAAVALVFLEAGVARAEPGVPVPPNQLITDTGSGKVAEADKDFAVKVRLAGLWEIPAGKMAQEKSGDARIRQIGKDIAAQHVVLDRMVREAATKLKITLPDEPNADQQGWLDEMRAAKGSAFDAIYVDRLRAAHGKIFPAIATIRTSTRNDTIRKLAQRANQFVATHLTLLESSGIVDFAALPTAPPPATAGAAAAAKPSSVLAAADAGRAAPPVNVPLVAGVAIAGLVVALFAWWRMFQSPRRRRRRYRGSYGGY